MPPVRLLACLALVALVVGGGVTGALSPPSTPTTNDAVRTTDTDGPHTAVAPELAASGTRGDAPEPGPPAADDTADDPEAAADLAVIRHDDPARSVVEDADGTWVATFTDGAYTVTLAGPERRFEEASATHGVTTDVWVRVLDEPFAGEVDHTWLEAARTDESPDVLEIATQYFDGAPDVVDEHGVLIAGDAGYGPLQPDGSRPVGSDWHDFRGVTATYGDIVDEPDPEEYRHLDCSGYVRTVFGARLGVPMTLRPDGGHSLPRRSFEQAAEAPGVVLVPHEGHRVTVADATADAPGAGLEPGDLVFFDAPSDDDGRIDHVGILLGVDDAGQHRFVHSRRSHNGPTMGGDTPEPSVLDGDGFFARGFRAVRRL